MVIWHAVVKYGSEYGILKGSWHNCMTQIGITFPLNEMEFLQDDVFSNEWADVGPVGLDCIVRENAKSYATCDSSCREDDGQDLRKRHCMNDEVVSNTI